MKNLEFEKMRNMILSIRPGYVKNIVNGKKKFEFRRKISKELLNNNIDKIYIYSTYPIRRIVGYFKNGHIIHECPEELWKITGSNAGIDKESFFKYFNGVKKGYAIEIKEIVIFEKKKMINPKNIIEGFRAPQNFRYIDMNI